MPALKGDEMRNQKVFEIWAPNKKKMCAYFFENFLHYILDQHPWHQPAFAK